MLPNTSVLVISLLSFLSLGACQQCRGQSCAIAALSGSTNESFDQIVKGTGGKTPSGSSSKGKDCITKYYKQLGLKAPGGGVRFVTPAQGPALQPTSSRMESADRLVLPRASRSEKRQGCKPYTLLFARGTTEPGTMGSTVGPALSSALKRQGGAKWKAEGVRYTADIAGDNCIGFPGGIKCVDQLSKLAAQCPETKFFLGGYSQGAMVARICTAYSKEDVKKRIKGVVVFGDPFNGASIKGFPQAGIKTLCAAGDGVCQGKFSISAAHLSYTAGSSVSQAAKWMVDRAQT